MREAYSPDSTEFMDLASLRRRGLSGTLRALRSCRPAIVTVTGDTGDIAVFGDVLSLMALAVSSPCRWYAPSGGTPVLLRRRRFPVLLGRTFLGIALGFAAALACAVRLRRLCAAGRDERPAGSQGSRCLYLKPALSFGRLVGGSVGHIAGVANALSRAGKEVRLAASTEQPLVSANVRQVTIKPPALAAYPHELNRFRYHRKYLREVRQQVTEFKPDFVYQRYSLDDMSGILLRQSLGIPLILEFNGSETWIQRHWGEALHFHSLAERIELANLRFADLVVVVSEEIRRQVCALGIPERRVLFYPNCVDSSMFDPDRFDSESVQRIRRELGVAPEADLFTFVGTFGPWHGTEVLATAIRHLADHERAFLAAHRVHFLLVGDGQYGEKIRSILKGLACVSLPGYRPQDEAPAILAASDFCLSPHVPNPDGSPFFGSPTKLFEYMAMAKPIVASDLDQIGWVLRGWKPTDPAPPLSDRTAAAAILVEPGDVNSLIQGIQAAINLDRADRVQLGQRARKLVMESFTWDQNVRAVLTRFEQFPGTGSPAAGAELHSGR